MHTHAEGSVRVRGRKRTWKRNREARVEAEVTAAAVVSLFGMRATDAARELGVSRSTLQRICRRLGIERWPCKTRQEAAEAVALGFFVD
jgi:hypothetical protein